MVCCFAVLWYGCRHKSLLKIGCTKDCADFCEPQETLLVAKSLLCCETCVKAENEHERQRQTRQRSFFRATELRKIPPRTAYIKDAGEREELREKLQHGLRAGQERQAEDMEEKMEDCGYKTDCAEQWTNDYAENIWQLKYAECEDSRGFEEDLLEMKNDIEHCEEFGWSIVHESTWDADYAEESDDRIVPQIECSKLLGTKPGSASTAGRASCTGRHAITNIHSDCSSGTAANAGSEKGFDRPRIDAAASVGDSTSPKTFGKTFIADSENVRGKAPVTTAFVCIPNPVGNPNVAGSVAGSRINPRYGAAKTTRELLTS
ncbi:hypothetical protein LMH87_002652 [Akanthomyces muscarius]|uniref:Uncharacterized protein n=1 Tax=Akanthomyces muscarius TaxID=2231603 RepID=A0A9W8Q9Z4_AKAMU|nr:hypothetical protein LMH87_002652 [Akanthomyces muscarius]KAJ4148171.1 hypothetical protein LMH87_002652 [Akanthomyces muscarius]